jgi:hypothetical protein
MMFPTTLKRSLAGEWEEQHDREEEYRKKVRLE